MSRPAGAPHPGGDVRRRRRGSPAPGTPAPLFPRGSGSLQPLSSTGRCPQPAPTAGAGPGARGGPGAGWPRGGARAVSAAPGALRRRRRVPMALPAEAARLDGGWQEVSEPRRYRHPPGGSGCPLSRDAARPLGARPFVPMSPPRTAPHRARRHRQPCPLLPGGLRAGTGPAVPGVVSC